jgi:solute carrier family 13 (sodium-dependent dicarboxylate transporter), member 2/3/5
LKTEDHIVVSDYLSDQMSEAMRAAADAHLAICPECREALAGARETRLESIAPPEEIKPDAGPLPLRVLLPKFAQGIWKTLSLIGRLGVVALLTGLVLLLPAPEGVTPDGQRALALLVFTASILALEPVALPIAALMVPLMQVAFGLAKTREAFEPFSRPVVFLILTSLFLAEALRKHGLTRRLALLTIVGSGGGVGAVLFGLMAIGALFSMWVENTATAAMLIPVALTLSRQVPDPKAARAFLVLLVLGIAYSASIGGMATIMGAASNAVTAGFLADIRPWRFMDWMKYGLPALAILFPITWWVLLKMVRVPFNKLDVEPARKALFKQGRMTGSEWELLATIGVAIGLWVAGEFLEAYFALPKTLLSSALVGVAAVAYLGIRNILNWDDVKGVSWGIFLIIGAGLSLGDALIRTGVTQWFATLVSPVVTGLPLFVSLMILVFASALLTNLLNNTTIAAVFVPVLISLAKSDPNFNAVQLVLPVALATTFGYSLPSASGRMALIAASGIITRGEMMRYGMVMTIVSSFALGLFFYILTLLHWI